MKTHKTGFFRDKPALRLWLQEDSGTGKGMGFLETLAKVLVEKDVRLSGPPLELLNLELRPLASPRVIFAFQDLVFIWS